MKKTIFYVSAAMLLTAAMSSLAQTGQPRTPITQQEWERMAPLPTMGWNSWNKFQRNINEKVLMDAADAMVASGMKDAGYEYVCVDDIRALNKVKVRLEAIVNFDIAMELLMLTIKENMQ